MARRFRRGLDYALATLHEGDPRLEVSLTITPTPGWAGGDDEDDAEDEDEEPFSPNGDGEVKEERQHEKSSRSIGDGSEEESGSGSENDEDGEEDEDDASSSPNDEGEEKEIVQQEGSVKPTKDSTEAMDDVGGHEVYMAGDDAAGGDAAIYNSSADTEDDNVLFAVPASWNKLSIVLRDSGVLRFMKYVSKAAKGDRWDVQGVYGVSYEEEAETERDEAVEESVGDEGEERQVSLLEVEGRDGDRVVENQVSLEDSEEEVFKGFPDSSDDDSDD